MTTHSPAYGTACALIATVATELPRWRSQTRWVDLVEFELLGLLYAVSTKRPSPEKLTRILRRFSTRLLHELGLTRRISRSGRAYRPGVPLARAVMLTGFIENRALVFLDRQFVLSGDTVAATDYLRIWQGFRMTALHQSLNADTLAWDDYEPSGLCGEVDLRMYHQLNQM